MFGLNEKITFTLHSYKGDLKHSYLTNTWRIPKDINYDFKLPEDINKVELKEFDGISKLTTIFTMYIGKERTFKDIIEERKNIIMSENINLENVNIENTKLLTKETETDVEVIKILGTNELVNEFVFESIEDMETYIRKLSIKIGRFNREVNNIKKLIRVTH